MTAATPPACPAQPSASGAAARRRVGRHISAREAASRIAIVAATSFIVGVAALSAAPRPVLAQTTGASSSIEDLQRELDQRDAIIGDLLRRVEELERAVGRTVAPEVGTGGEAPATAEPLPASVPSQGPPPTTGREQDRVANGETAPVAPGEFEVDEAAIERALERTLVQTGALLLPFGAVEVEPDLTYIRRETDAPVFFTEDGLQFLAADEVRRDIVEAGLVLRLGLPLDSQLEIDVPYRYEEESTVTRVRFAERLERTRQGSGFGDIGIAFTKTLLRESTWRPDLFGSVLWDTGTGESEEGLELGSGFDEVGASLTAVKRTDPLVWVGRLSYLHAFEDDNIRPGDEFGLSLGTVLAVSPSNSLRFFLDQTFVDEAELSGTDIAGSDQVVSTFTIGASSVLSRRVLLDLQAGIGLTEDAPDYFFQISLPIRFNLF